MLKQVPPRPQSLWPAAHLHCPAEHVFPVDAVPQVKLLPHPPQLELSVLKLVQPLPQAFGVVPEQTQLPPEQIFPCDVQD